VSPERHANPPYPTLPYPTQPKPNQPKPNQTKPKQTKPNQTKPNQTKPTKPNQTYLIKPTKPNLPNQTYKTKHTKPNQIYQTNFHFRTNLEFDLKDPVLFLFVFEIKKFNKVYNNYLKQFYCAKARNLSNQTP
jgi:hypothetical protein